MLCFETSSYAIAGVIVAAVPILIHLFHRRSFKTVHWAAVEFLKQAFEKERKRLRVRDLLLLICRILAVLAIAIVFAKPSFQIVGGGAAAWMRAVGICALVGLGAAVGWATSPPQRGRVFAALFFLCLIAPLIHLFEVILKPASPGEAAHRTPIHAILLIDNSRSLAVETAGGLLLDRAKSKAIEFIDRLPAESRITVIPLCGADDVMTSGGFRNKEDARDAISRITVVDVRGNNLIGFSQAEAACRQTVDPAVKRVVLLTDLQANSWREAEGVSNWLDPGKFPSVNAWGLQIANVSREPASNVWVTGFHLEDQLASNDAPCRFLARVHSGAPEGVPGSSGRNHFLVQARLLINESVVSSQTVEMTPGQEREIEFTHQFDLRIDPLKPNSVLAAVEIQSELPAMDQLPRDNRQQLVVPIASSVPIVFVDQFGNQEDLDQNRIGETYALRHLMAPRSNGGDSQQRLVNYQHVRPEELSRTNLESVRLVVVAGIERPDLAFVSLLHEFVTQGGSLVILAGGQFDPAAWTENAWLDGRGVLPVPLEKKPIGHLPDEVANRIETFMVSFASMQSDYFLIEGEDPKTLASLFEATPFFKAVEATVDSQFLREQSIRDAKRFDGDKQFREDYEHRQANQNGRAASDQIADDDEQRYRQLVPTWWNWRKTELPSGHSFDGQSHVEDSRPKVLATFEGNGHPWVVERQTGAGKIVLFTSGVTSNWNLLRSSPVMYLFHRTFCHLIERTFPRRIFIAGETLSLPVERRSHRRYVLKHPTGVSESFAAETVGAGRALVAGVYRFVAEAREPSSSDVEHQVSDEFPIAVNGDEGESDLRSIPAIDLRERLSGKKITVLDVADPIRIEGGANSGWWKFIGWCALALLLAEKWILAWPQIRHRLATVKWVAES